MYECVGECEKYQECEGLGVCEYGILVVRCVCDEKASGGGGSGFEGFVDGLEEE